MTVGMNADILSDIEAGMISLVCRPTSPPAVLHGTSTVEHDTKEATSGMLRVG